MGSRIRADNVANSPVSAAELHPVVSSGDTFCSLVDVRSAVESRTLPSVNDGLDVYRYLDYRRLLADYYRMKKAEGRGFSYRAFSRRAGLSSPNHLKRVMDGARNLSARSAEQYSQAMGLDGERADYFTSLVRFNQATSSRDRQQAYQHLRSFRGYQSVQLIDARYAHYHAHWYVPTIREMALRRDFRADPAWIAERLLPPIQVAEAAEALDVLFALGMLSVDDSGRVQQAEPVVSTGEQTQSLHISRYHAGMLDMAKSAIDDLPPEQRYITSLTFCVSESAQERVRQRIARFRQELIAELAEETEGDRVLQLGIQLFPLTRGSDR